MIKSKRTLKIILAIWLSVLFALLSSSCLCMAQESYYRITEEELTQLETNLATLKANKQSLLIQLNQLEKQQVKLEEQLKTSEALSKQQENLLKIANESLAKYEQEEKAKINRYKWQRNIAYTICGGLLVAYIRRA